MSTTVSRYVVETIRQAGVDVFFGLPGVHALGLFHAVEQAGAGYIGFRHEQAAAHAADGYGRTTGRPGVVLLSTGPGALNALSALGEAYASSSPVLAITSSVPSSLAGLGKGYLHEVKNLAPAFESVTRFHGRAGSAGEVPDLLERALVTSAGGRPGPAMLEIPVDLLDAPIEAEARAPKPHAKQAEAAAVEEAAGLLGLAARPLVWAGGGVIRSGASEALARVAEILGAPVVTTFMGKGAIPESHPLAVGSLVRQPEVVEMLEEADALLAVGTRFSAMSTGNWKTRIPAQLVHVDIDPEEIGRNYPVRVGIEADARKALEALGAALGEGASADRAWGERAVGVRATAIERARREGPREMAVLDAVRAALDPETVTVHDMTVPSYWAWPFFPVEVPGTFHSPYGFGSLGFSLPAAIGVAAADGSRPVVSFNGDGGFQYHGRELATVAQYSLPVVALVFNDRSWGVLRAFSRARYGSEFGLDLPFPDFPSLAAAHGVAALRAEEPDEIEKALREALGSGDPHLIEVPGAWALPPPSGYYR